MPSQRIALASLIVFFIGCADEPEVRETAIPVRMEVAKRAAFTPSITLLGVVRPAQTIPLAVVQSGTVSYPARFAGGLQTGAQVKRGEAIAIVQNDRVVLSQTQARLQWEAANADFDRAKRSFDQGVMSSAEFSAYRFRMAHARETYDASTRDTSRLRVIAPQSGTLVVGKSWPAGANLDAGAVLAEIAAGGAPRIESSVAASERALLRPGLAVRFSDGAQAGGTGRVTEVASVIDASGTARVVAEITGGTIPPPGSGVEVAVELDRRADVLSVPEEAIVAAADGPAVFVATVGEGSYRASRVKRVRVETGGRANGRVEIVSGLRDGDRVVVSGADALTDDVVVTDAGETK